MRDSATLVLVAILVLATWPAAKTAAGPPLVDLESGRSLVSNMKAHRLGDILTILIVEQSTADATSKTDANTKSETSGGPGLGALDLITGWGLDTESKFKGDGRTQRSGSLQAEITVRIVEVLHNGDYQVSGTRMVEINGERQLIEIAGICRERDIQPNNTILSTYIADARISYSGSGAVNAASEPGLVTKIVNWLF